MQRKELVMWLGLAVVLWFVISWYWYVCSIKGFCMFDSAVETDEAVIPVELRDESRVITPRGNSTTRKTTTTKTVEEITVECPAYLQSYIRYGYANSSSDVRRLEEFLNTYEDENLDVDGQYSRTDEQAVMRFQEKYRAEVMDPWGMTTPSGYVYQTTLQHINALQCAFSFAEDNQ